jgi:hypothetical protein
VRTELLGWLQIPKGRIVMHKNDNQVTTWRQVMLATGLDPSEIARFERRFKATGFLNEAIRGAHSIEPARRMIEMLGAENTYKEIFVLRYTREMLRQFIDWSIEDAGSDPEINRALSRTQSASVSESLAVDERARIVMTSPVNDGDPSHWVLLFSKDFLTSCVEPLLNDPDSVRRSVCLAVAEAVNAIVTHGPDVHPDEIREFLETHVLAEDFPDPVPTAPKTVRKNTQTSPPNPPQLSQGSEQTAGSENDALVVSDLARLEFESLMQRIAPRKSSRRP